MPRNTAHEPAGKPTGGQFAKTAHSESAVELSAADLRDQERLHEHARPLTVDDVESLRRIHGTEWAGRNGFYNIQMPKVFAAAEEKASASPEGRLELAQRAKAEELAAITGVPARDILEYHESCKDLEPGTDPWRAKAQQWTDILRIPYGSMMFIDEKIRAATGEPSRDELAAQRRELNARIGAVDVTSAAAAVSRRFPDATTVTAFRSSHQVFDPDELTVRVTNQDNRPIWEGPRAQIPELGELSLIPDPYQRQDSPLRTSAVRHYNHTWRSYDLTKMAAVTAAELMEEA